MVSNLFSVSVHKLRRMPLTITAIFCSVAGLGLMISSMVGFPEPHEFLEKYKRKSKLFIIGLALLCLAVLMLIFKYFHT